MIQQLINEYIQAKGVQPFALLMNSDFPVDEELPRDVFVCWSERVWGISIVPLDTAKIFIYGSLFRKVEAASE